MQGAQQTLSFQCLQDQMEELRTSREAAASAELQELRSAQEAAQAELAQAEATISALTSEKDAFAKRCVAQSVTVEPVPFPAPATLASNAAATTAPFPHVQLCV